MGNTEKFVKLLKLLKVDLKKNNAKSCNGNANYVNLQGR